MRATKGLIMAVKDKPDPDDELAAGLAGHPATSEEAMDAMTEEDGHVEESAYTPAPGLLDEPGSVEAEQR